MCIMKGEKEQGAIHINCELILKDWKKNIHKHITLNTLLSSFTSLFLSQSNLIFFYSDKYWGESDQQRQDQFSQTLEKIPTTITSSAKPANLMSPPWERDARYPDMENSRGSFTRDLCRHLVDLEIASKDPGSSTATILARCLPPPWGRPFASFANYEPGGERAAQVYVHTTNNTSRECNARTTLFECTARVHWPPIPNVTCRFNHRSSPAISTVLQRRIVHEITFLGVVIHTRGDSCASPIKIYAD